MSNFFPVIVWVMALLGPAGVLAAGNDWMSGMDGNLRLSQMSIPGTHNSCARYEPWAGTAICQNTTIAEQLKMGIRAFDIRCRHTNNSFAIHHGSVYQKLSFGDVLSQVYSFLDGNPGECVILSVKEEHESSGITRSFEATFDWYVSLNPGKWWMGSTVPALNVVRGKIVLLRRFNASSTPKGIVATDWPDNRAGGFFKGNLSVQDWYAVTNKTAKWFYITNALSAAYAETDANVLHLNFCSGYESLIFGIPNIGRVSSYVNPMLLSYFSNSPGGHYGCVMMDFADAAKASLIYGANLRSAAPLRTNIQTIRKPIDAPNVSTNPGSGK